MQITKMCRDTSLATVPSSPVPTFHQERVLRFRKCFDADPDRKFCAFLLVWEKSLSNLEPTEKQAWLKHMALWRFPWAKKLIASLQDVLNEARCLGGGVEEGFTGV